MNAIPVHIQLLIGAGLAIGYIGYTLYQNFRQGPQGYGREEPGPSRRAPYERVANEFPPHRSKPGDICVICLRAMYRDDMQFMPCHHALHTCCYNECKRRVSFCPLCKKRM